MNLTKEALGLNKSKSKEKVEPLKDLSDTLRGKHGIEYRTAVLDENRVEFIRGKDFATYFQDNAGQMKLFVSGNKKVDDQVKEIAELLMRKGYLVRTERMFKKPKPGKKKLAKWPKKLVRAQSIEFQTEEAFYAWMYDRPTSPWLYVGAVALAVIVVLMCLFPLAPYWVKISVVYMSMFLLMFILGLLLVRGTIAGVTWVVTGRSLWIFPNMLSEELGITDAFKPLISFDKPEEGKEPHWLGRLGVGAAVFATLYAIYTFSPDSDTLKDKASKAKDSLFDVLNLHDPGLQKLAGNVTGNATAGEQPFDGSATAGGAFQDADAASQPHAGVGGEGQQGEEADDDVDGDEEQVEQQPATHDSSEL